MATSSPHVETRGVVEPRPDGLEHHYDVVIIGTGMVESMVSAALAKVGKSVLHYEKRGLYGGESWTSFSSLDDLLEWVADRQSGAVTHHESPNASSAPTVVPTHDVLRRRWPQHRWRGALMGDKAKMADAGVSEDSGSTPAVGSTAHLPPEMDIAVPEQSYVVPLLLEAYSPVRLLRVSERTPELCPSGEEGVDDAQERVEGVHQHAPPLPPPAGDGEAGVGGLETQASTDEEPATVDEAKTAAGTEVAKDESHTRATPDVLTLDYLREMHSRRFALDLVPSVILSGGDMIDPLITSGVAKYLEFLPLEALYVAATEGPSEQPGAGLVLHKVPCSKNDVFASRLLPAKEKRQLMRLLQFVADWGFEQTGKEVAVRNETELGQGRSLNRPQNKKTVEFDATPFLDKPLTEFLEHARLDAHLRWVVMYALALVGDDQEIRPVDTRTGLMRLFKHLNGLGRSGTTVFLWPVYGVGEVVQAFCRTSSVWGGTFILRHTPTALVIGTPSAQAEKPRCLGVHDGDVPVACDFVVLGQDAMPGCRPSDRGSCVRRITLVDRSVLGTGVLRAGAVMPPGAIKKPSTNRHSIHLHQLDSDTCVVPKGIFVLYMSTVADSGDLEQGAAVLEAAARALTMGAGAVEIYSVVYAEPLLDPPALVPIADGASHVGLPDNLLYVKAEPPEFYLQTPLDQAREVFQRICPGEPFLPAEVPEGLAPYAQPSERDEEAALLEAALHESAAPLRGDAEVQDGGSLAGGRREDGAQEEQKIREQTVQETAGAAAIEEPENR